jgi:hypothetical protein
VTPAKNFASEFCGVRIYLLALGFAGCHRVGHLLGSSQQTLDDLYHLMSFCLGPLYILRKRSAGRFVTLDVSVVCSKARWEVSGV